MTGMIARSDFYAVIFLLVVLYGATLRHHESEAGWIDSLLTGLVGAGMLTGIVYCVSWGFTQIPMPF